MKKLVSFVAAAALCASTVGCSDTQTKNNESNMTNEKILFINGSPNKDGNTAALAATLLEGKEYESLYLTDYQLNFFGQDRKGDQFDEILKKMQAADIVVIGSPVYWHNICASVRAFMERFYNTVEGNAFEGKRLFFLYQGEAPTQMMAGSNADTFYLTEQCFSHATGTQDKQLFLIPGARHIQTYYVPEYVNTAVDKLTTFFGRTL